MVAWNEVDIKSYKKDDKRRLLNEIRLLNDLNHENLLKFYETWRVTDNGENKVVFVTEMLQGGTLKE